MEQFDSSVEESSKVSEQQQRNDEQQCPSCVAELTEASVWMIAASETDCMGYQISKVAWLLERSSQVTFLQPILSHVFSVVVYYLVC